MSFAVCGISSGGRAPLTNALVCWVGEPGASWLAFAVLPGFDFGDLVMVPTAGFGDSLFGDVGFETAGLSRDLSRDLARYVLLEFHDSELARKQNTRREDEYKE